MTLDDAIEFIVAKTELLARHAGSPAERDRMQQMLRSYDQLWGHPRLSLQQLRDIDGEGLELFLTHSVSPAARTRIRAELLARFKTTRLRKSDTAVAQRVLKRGRIADLEEYYQVKEVVSCTDNIEVFGEDAYRRLDHLVEAYDAPSEELPEPPPLPAPGTTKRPTRRRAPPVFDYVLTDDEKLCPPDTPVAQRLAFLRAKFDLVLQQIADAHRRETLHRALSMTLDGQLKQAADDHARREAAAWSEHEADYFPGYEVSGTTHREIETKLERQFGFRRLGPSAQAHVRRLLATGASSDRLHRLIVERFIHAYPHQTLFTKDEIKRATRLLKSPPPA